MGSLTFDGVRFQVWSSDHLPPHAHAYYSGVRAVVVLGEDGNVWIRPGSVDPVNAKRNEVKRIADAARQNYALLMKLWEATHGTNR